MNPIPMPARLCAMAVAVLAACAPAQAAPVTLNFQGHVTGYDFIDLGAWLPLGAAVSLSLTFNETFSDGSYDFSDALGPVSGSMSVGSASFVFNGYEAYSYQGGFGGFPLAWVMPRFVGNGPVLGGGDLFGLFAQITPALTLVDDLRLGYGFTTVYPDGISITNYGYAKLTADHYTITPTPGVPAPATLVLAATALLAAGAARRRIQPASAFISA